MRVQCFLNGKICTYLDKPFLRQQHEVVNDMTIEPDVACLDEVMRHRLLDPAIGLVDFASPPVCESEIIFTFADFFNVFNFEEDRTGFGQQVFRPFLTRRDMSNMSKKAKERPTAKVRFSAQAYIQTIDIWPLCCVIPDAAQRE